MSVAAVRSRVSPDGAACTLVLEGEPGNVIGIATCEALMEALERAAGDGRTRLIVLRGAGRHFSYGASIEEHLPDQARRMLDRMSAAVQMLAGLPIPTLAAIHGRCLGGGLELALACGMAWAEEGAVLAAPEIRLGVFAPAATALLEGRLPRAILEDLLLTGREVGADEALRLGLVSRLVPEGTIDDAVETFVTERLRGASLLGLRTATTAIRSRPSRLLRRRLQSLERLYLKKLSSDEGSEGIRSFLEKRPPRWPEGRAGEEARR